MVTAEHTKKFRVKRHYLGGRPSAARSESLLTLNFFKRWAPSAPGSRGRRSATPMYKNHPKLKTFLKNSKPILKKYCGVPGGEGGAPSPPGTPYPLTRRSMYFSSGPRRRLGGAYMLVQPLVVWAQFPLVFLVNGTCGGKLCRSTAGAFWGVLTCLFVGMLVRPRGYQLFWKIPTGGFLALPLLEGPVFHRRASRHQVHFSRWLRSPTRAR